MQVPAGAPSATVEVRSELGVPVGDVWAVLDDFRRLAGCLPGAELVEVLGDDRYRGRARVALGPVRLAFEGLAQVVERLPGEHRMRVLAQGADTGGSATQADIRLAAEPAAGGGTVLRAEADLYLSGRIAQFGRALAGDVSRRLFEQFGAAVELNARGGSAPAAKPPSMLALLAGTVTARLRALLRRVR
jgi:carbon-monoxide dehydrogenase small subunit